MSFSDCSLVNFPLEIKPLTYSYCCTPVKYREDPVKKLKNAECFSALFNPPPPKKECRVFYITQANLSTLPKSAVQNSQRQSSNQIPVCFDLKLCVCQKTSKPWN